jgi:hypothetical protein
VGWLAAALCRTEALRAKVRTRPNYAAVRAELSNSGCPCKALSVLAAVDVTPFHGFRYV